MRSSRTTRSDPGAVVVLLVGVLSVGLIGGCTPDEEAPELPIDGLLTPADLGPGEWSGPYEDILASPADRRATTCGFLAGLFYTYGKRPEVERRALWVRDQTAVTSIVDRYEEGSYLLAERIEDFRALDGCRIEGGDPSDHDPAYSFAWEDVDGVIVVEERNRSGQRDWVLETAVTITTDSFVGVEVSYPDGTTDHPDVLALLDTAVEASAELTGVVEPDVGP